jgi:hypothetical protein
MTTDEIMALADEFGKACHEECSAYWLDSPMSEEQARAESERQRSILRSAIEALQADAARWRWAKVFVSGDDNDEANKRTALLAAQYFVGVKDVDAAIDAAMALDKS